MFVGASKRSSKMVSTSGSGAAFKDWVLRFRVYGLGFKDLGLGFRVQISGFRV